MGLIWSLWLDILSFLGFCTSSSDGGYGESSLDGGGSDGGEGSDDRYIDACVVVAYLRCCAFSRSRLVLTIPAWALSL